MDLEANRYHTFNATAVSHCAGGSPVVLPVIVSDPRGAGDWIKVRMFYN